MRQLRECYWMVEVEAGDTPETVAHWIEDNVVDNDGNRYKRGDVNIEGWPLDPKPGDFLLFETPPPFATQRYPGFVNRLPDVTANRELESKFIARWAKSNVSLMEKVLRVLGGKDE